MKLTKQFKINFVRKVHAFLNDKSHKIRIMRKRRKVAGEIRYKPPVEVDINPFKNDDPCSILIHEILHFHHPNWSEKQVLEAEKQMMRSLTSRQYKNIVKKLVSRK